MFVKKIQAILDEPEFPGNQMMAKLLRIKQKTKGETAHTLVIILYILLWKMFFPHRQQ
jgi:hypothetical protein